MNSGVNVSFRRDLQGTSPRRGVRPISARQVPPGLTDLMASQLLAKSRELTRTHFSLVRSGRFSKPVHEAPPVAVEEATESIGVVISPVIQTTVVRKEQGTSPLTTFQDSYILPDHFRSTTIQPVVHNIDVEAFQPLAPKARKHKATPSHRVLLSWKGSEGERNGPSTTPDKMTQFNSHVLKEYHGLFVAPRSLGDTNLSPYRSEFKNPLSNKTLRKMSDPGTCTSTNPLQLRTAKNPTLQQAICERKHPARTMRFTKRPLSASYSFRSTKSVFDPYDVYNVASGLFACR